MAATTQPNKEEGKTAAEAKTPAEKAQPKNEPAKPALEPDLAGPTIYLGPNLPGGVLSRGAVFTGRLPAAVLNLAGESPELADLLVPVAKLPAAKKELATPNSRLSRAHLALGKRYRGERG